jgi:hypothetical protein
MDKLITGLGPAFAAGLAIQQLLELLDPLLSRVIPPAYKKVVLGVLSLAAGLALAVGASLRVLEPLGVPNAGVWDGLVTGFIISGGTQGINSILKFLGYAKEGKKADALTRTEAVKAKVAQFGARV